MKNNEFLRFTKMDIAWIVLLLAGLAISLGYYYGTQYNFQTKAITKVVQN